MLANNDSKSVVIVGAEEHVLYGGPNVRALEVAVALQARVPARHAAPLKHSHNIP